MTLYHRKFVVALLFMKGGSFFITTLKKGKVYIMQEEELKYYEEIKDWDFSMFEIESESLTNWDFFETLKKIADKNARILDLGTGGGEKVLKYYPDCKEILGTDFSKGMIETANKNLEQSGRCNIKFRLMDNLKMDVPENYYDIVTARHTVTDPKQIYK